MSNPDRLAVKRANPELFKFSRDLTVALPGLPDKVAHFSAIGNHFLLRRSLWQVQVSRRDFAYSRPYDRACSVASPPPVERSTATFRERREAAFSSAANGDVILSPCVSDGERQIAREILAAGYSLVVLRNKGFTKFQKPSGRYFEACAEGRLLMLSPAAWPYVPGEKPMTRFDATVMNRLCQWLAGDDAATINYHGMKPTNVDELACKAAFIEPQSHL